MGNMQKRSGLSSSSGSPTMATSLVPAMLSAAAGAGGRLNRPADAPGEWGRGGRDDPSKQEARGKKLQI
jgi:hypothetical protein